MQRRIETAVRRQKDAAIAANAAGDDVLRRECQAKINGIQKRYGAVSRAAGLDVQKERMTVSGFHRVKTREGLRALCGNRRSRQPRHPRRAQTPSERRGGTSKAGRSAGRSTEKSRRGTWREIRDTWRAAA